MYIHTVCRNAVKSPKMARKSIMFVANDIYWVHNRPKYHVVDQV
jgi:hypothetical protein